MRRCGLYANSQLHAHECRRRLGEYFLHRLGHGIGLVGHEPPYLVAGNNVPLVARNAVTIEPGLCLRGQFGVRIEDSVALTAEGAQRMNNAPRKLMIVH